MRLLAFGGRGPAFTLALLFGLLSSTAQAQTAASPPADLPASQAAGIIREITEAVGLQPRFELRATTQVANAAAVVYDGRRFLLYNPRFLAAVNRAGHTDWAGISILAHEMGHHLDGHTLRAGGSQPQDELEADEFSGFVLRRLGASLSQAQAALAAASPEAGSATHPGRAPRLAAIGRGWNRATAQLAANSAAPAPSAQPLANRVLPATPRPVVSIGSPDPVAARAASAEAVAEVRAGADQPVRVLGQLTFRDNPAVPFYLTSALTVVRLPEEGSPDDDPADRLANAQVVGRLRRTDSAAFPFVLEDGQQRALFITPRGDVYDKEGRRVAKLL